MNVIHQRMQAIAGPGEDFRDWSIQYLTRLGYEFVDQPPGIVSWINVRRDLGTWADMPEIEKTCLVYLQSEWGYDVEF